MQCEWPGYPQKALQLSSLVVEEPEVESERLAVDVAGGSVLLFERYQALKPRMIVAELVALGLAGSEAQMLDSSVVRR